MAQTAGSIQNITYDDIIDGLGFVPADSSAVQNLTASDISTALGCIKELCRQCGKWIKDLYRCVNSKD